MNCSERKKPPIRRMTIISQTGVAGVKAPQITMNKPANTAFTVRTRRKPKCRTMGVATNFISSAPAALANVISPAEKGDRPKPTCSSMASRKGVAPTAKRHRLPPSVAMAKVGIRIRDRSMIGCSARRACQPYRKPQAVPVAISPSSMGSGITSRPMASKPLTSAARQMALSRKPGQSRLGVPSSRISAT
ncbi:hypothetical protein D9M69_542890 [compost metagenome]